MMILRYILMAIGAFCVAAAIGSFIIFLLSEMSSALFGKPKKRFDLIWFLNTCGLLLFSCTLIALMLAFLDWLSPRNG